MTMKITLNGTAIDLTDATVVITVPVASPVPAPSPPVAPPAPPAPPVATAPVKPVSQNLVATAQEIRVGDTFAVIGMLNYPDKTTAPVTAYRLYDFGKVIALVTPFGTSFKAIAEGSTTLHNDNLGTTGALAITVLPADSSRGPVDTTPPPAKAPAPPAGSSPSPAPPAPASFKFDPPPASPQGTGSHVVKATVDTKDGHIWTAEAHVGDDATAPFVYCAFVNEAGEASPMLTTHAYADKCHVAIGRLDAATDMENCGLKVEYDGVEVFNEAAVNFPLGQWNNAILYGKPAPWKSVVRHPLLPNFAWGESQTIYNDSGADYSYNGFGVDPQASTETTGERGAIGYPTIYDMSFVLQPSDATWALTRKVADTCFGRSTVRWIPATGAPVSIDDYPQISTFAAAQSVFSGNPIPIYQGVWDSGTLKPTPNRNHTSSNGRGSDTAHQTHFSIIAALATGSAHDLDAVAFQANAPLLNMNPAYRAKSLMYQQQVRSLAWSVAYVFVASQVGRFTPYFKHQMDKQLAIIKAQPANPMHMYAFIRPYFVASMPGWTGGAAWQEDYVQLVFDPIGFVLPEWRDVVADHALARVMYFVRDGKLRPACINCTAYDRLHVDPTGKWVDVDASDVATLQGMGWTLADAQAFVAATDVNVAIALYVKNRPTAAPIKVSASGMPDIPFTAASPDGYTSQMEMALASAVNYRVEGWEVCKQWLDEHPTKPNFTANQKYHVEPRATVPS